MKNFTFKEILNINRYFVRNLQDIYLRNSQALDEDLLLKEKPCKLLKPNNRV